VLKRFISTLSGFITIADIFGYVLVSIIACSLWIGYQKAENITTQTAILARNQALPLKQSIRSKLKEMEQATNSIPAKSDKKSNENPAIQEGEIEGGINKYLKKIKSSLGIFNIKTAKETVGNLNASVTEVLTEVTTDLTEDPRSVNFGKGTPKERNPHHKAEVRDSLAPF